MPIAFVPSTTQLTRGDPTVAVTSRRGLTGLLAAGLGLPALESGLGLLTLPPARTGLLGLALMLPVLACPVQMLLAFSTT